MCSQIVRNASTGVNTNITNYFYGRFRRNYEQYVFWRFHVRPKNVKNVLRIAAGRLAVVVYGTHSRVVRIFILRIPPPENGIPAKLSKLAGNEEESA